MRLENDFKHYFGFLDNETFRFYEFDGNQIWHNKEDFKKDFIGENIDSFLNLIPGHNESSYEVTYRRISDSSFPNAWQYICGKYGIDDECLSKGTRYEDTLKITITDLKLLGIFK